MLSLFAILLFYLDVFKEAEGLGLVGCRALLVLIDFGVLEVNLLFEFVTVGDLALSTSVLVAVKEHCESEQELMSR